MTTNAEKRLIAADTRWAIGMRALEIKLRNFELTMEEATARAAKEIAAMPPRRWRWGKVSKAQIRRDAGELLRQINTPVRQPPLVMRSPTPEPLPVKVAKKVKELLHDATTSTSPTPTPEQQQPPPALPLIYVHRSGGSGRHGPLVDLTEEFLADPRFAGSSTATAHWLADHKRNWR